jgi:hypothetical protein
MSSPKITEFRIKGTGAANPMIQGDSHSIV